MRRWREARHSHSGGGQIGVLVLQLAIESEATFLAIVGEEGTHVVDLAPACLTRQDGTALSKNVNKKQRRQQQRSENENDRNYTPLLTPSTPAKLQCQKKEISPEHEIKMKTSHKKSPCWHLDTNKWPSMEAREHKGGQDSRTYSNSASSTVHL